MDAGIYQMLFVLSTASSYALLTERIRTDLGGLLSALLWSVVAFGSFDVEVVSNGTVVSAVSGSYEPLAFIAMAGFALGTLFTVEDVVDSVPDMSGTLEGVRR